MAILKKPVGEIMKRKIEAEGELKRCFVSPNVADSNCEPANVVDVLASVAKNAELISRGGPVPRFPESH